MRKKWIAMGILAAGILAAAWRLLGEDFFQLLCLVADGGNTGAFDAAADGPSVCGIRGSGLDVLKDFGLFDSRVSHLGSCGGRGSAFYRRRLCGRDSILGGF